jgi:hypothetical protein
MWQATPEASQASWAAITNNQRPAARRHAAKRLNAITPRTAGGFREEHFLAATWAACNDARPDLSHMPHGMLSHYYRLLQEDAAEFLQKVAFLNSIEGIPIWAFYV